MLVITGWATLFCGLLFCGLTWQVIRSRQKQGVPLGDGGDKLVMRRMRGQANAAEQMPITLLALGLAEQIGGTTMLLGFFALTFCLGRLAHGYAFGWLEHSAPLRVYGMLASFAGSILTLLYLGYALLAG